MFCVVRNKNTNQQAVQSSAAVEDFPTASPSLVEAVAMCYEGAKVPAAAIFLLFLGWILTPSGQICSDHIQFAQWPVANQDTRLISDRQ